MFEKPKNDAASEKHFQKSDPKVQLWEAKAELDNSIEIYKKLQVANDRNSNYRHIDHKENQHWRAMTLIYRADVFRHLAELTPPHTPEDRAEHEKALVRADEDLVAAGALIGEIQNAPKKKYCGGEFADEAFLAEQTGRLRYSQKVVKGGDKALKECREFYQDALTRYRAHIADGYRKWEEDVARVEALVDTVEMEIDKVGVIMRKIQQMSGPDSKEEQALRRAFDNFDTDRSGCMDMQEFWGLANELGAYPPLTEDELKEALIQIDNTLDGELQFDELWAWWMSDLVFASIDAGLKGRGR